MTRIIQIPVNANQLTGFYQNKPSLKDTFKQTIQIVLFTLKRYKRRNRSGTATISQTKPVTKANDRKPLTIVTKSSAPDAAGVPYQPPS